MSPADDEHIDVGINVFPGYGGGTGPILLNDVRCTGRETSLSECSSVSVYNCVHNNDVGVRCFKGKFTVICSE